MSAGKDDFAAYTTIGDRTEQPAEARAPLHARPSGPSFAPPPKLEPFLLLAKSARGAGAAGLVSQAVGAPGVYVFGELLEQPSIKDLANLEQHAAQYRLLELFAYGTWADYEAKRDSFPALTPEQETKLKHLTILTLASSQRVIPYATLLSLLSLPDVPTLEDLLVGAFYAHVLHGKLDAKAQRLEVLSAQGRDVRPSAPQEQVQEESMELDAPASGASSAAQSPASLLAALSTFQATLGGLIASLTAHLSALHAHAANTAAHSAAHEQRVRGVAEEVSKEGAGGKKGRGGAGGGAKQQQQREPAGEGDMDVDSAPAPGGSGTVGAFPGMGALAGAFGLSGSGGAPQGTARGAAGSPTGGGAGARARKRGRQ